MVFVGAGLCPRTGPLRAETSPTPTTCSLFSLPPLPQGEEGRGGEGPRLVVRVPLAMLDPLAEAADAHVDLVPLPIALGVARVVADRVLLAQLLEDVAE